MICYAPIENLSDGTFKGCTNLREVIFVNGVRSLGDYVFSDCLSLEAVYLGAYVENASESAFQDEYGVEYFALEDCITDPAQLPDVDALLAAVKCDPMPEPTPAPTPEPALPVGAEGEPFFGEWHGMSMEMDGETFSFDDVDMVMDLTLNEDGTAALFDGEETDLTSWKVEDGVAIIDTMRGSIQPDGSLCLEEDGSKLYFTGDAPEAPAAEPVPETTSEPATLPEPAAGGAEVMIGKKYVMTDADVNGYNMTAAQMGNFEYSILLQEDGAVTFVMAGSDIPGLTWAYGRIPTEAGEVDGVVIDYYTQALNLVPTEKGFDMDYFGSMLMHFAPEDSAQ